MQVTALIGKAFLMIFLYCSSTKTVTLKNKTLVIYHVLCVQNPSTHHASTHHAIFPFVYLVNFNHAVYNKRYQNTTFLCTFFFMRFLNKYKPLKALCTKVRVNAIPSDAVQLPICHL